jgi:hypothetical protein
MNNPKSEPDELGDTKDCRCDARVLAVKWRVNEINFLNLKRPARFTGNWQRRL